MEKERDSQTTPPIQPWFAEDEIDLYELFENIWRKKWIIFLCFISAVAVAAAYLFVATPLYRIGAQIKPASIIWKGKKPITIVTPQDISKWFSNNSYQSYLKEKFPKCYANVKISPLVIRRGTTIFLEMFFPNPQKGEKILSEVLEYYKNILEKNNKDIRRIKKNLEEEIKKTYKEIEKLELQKRTISRQIMELSEKIKLKQLEKTLLEANLKAYQNTSKNLENIVAEVDKNTRDLMRLRTALLKKQPGRIEVKKEIGIDQMTLLLYSNIIQQNISYMSTLEMRILNLDKEQLDLQKRLNEINLTILALKNQIENLKQKRDEELEKNKAILEADIEKIKADLENLRVFDVIQPPVSSTKPVKPKKALVLAVAGVSGLFVGLFLALILHGVEERRKSMEKNQ